LIAVLWLVAFPVDCHEVMMPCSFPNLVQIFCDKISKAENI
jgi:hypothetical protein